MVTATKKPHPSARAADSSLRDAIPAPITLNLPSDWSTNNDAMLELAALNESWVFELSANGKLVIMTGVGFRSSNRAIRIAAQVENWSVGGGEGYVCGADLWYRREDSSLRLPDVAWISDTRLRDRDPGEGVLEVCPELIVEVVSVSQEHEAQQEKMNQWMAEGALLGWLIDPFRDTVHIYRPGSEPELLQRPATLSGEDVCEGLDVSLERIWK